MCSTGINWDNECMSFDIRLPWIAPELYTDLTRMTKYSDRYAYGITLWEILSEGDRPFMYMDFREVSMNIRKYKHILGYLWKLLT